MRKTLSFIAVLVLSACMGGDGGSDDDVVVAPSAEPDPAVTAEIGTMLNNARSGSLSGLKYNDEVGVIAQSHAQDMVDRNYLSTFDKESSGCAGPRGGECDMGDDLVAAGLSWVEIVQMVAEGDKPVSTVYSEFDSREISDGVEGDLGSKLQGALEFDEGYEFFALGKAGSGNDTKWALIVVHPDQSWSER